MKFTFIFMFLFIISTVFAQKSPILVEKRQITDLSKYPIYPRLIEERAGQTVWKAEYEYLDEIDLYVISYLSDGLKVRGLMAKPKKAGNYPCVIYNRGGNRDFGQLLVYHAAVTLGQIAKEGYVVIASQYRGNSGGEGQEEFGGKDVNDVLNLIDVLKEVESANTEKIGMYGWSRGGMMTYLALTKTDKIKAAIVGGAISDLTVIDRPKMETGVYAELIPDYWNNKEQALKERSIIHQLDKFPRNVPILMLHGAADWRVKPDNSLKLALEFDKLRIPYRLMMFEGADHGISENTKERDQQVISWFDRYLKNGEALPNMEYHGK